MPEILILAAALLLFAVAIAVGVRLMATAAELTAAADALTAETANTVQFVQMLRANEAAATENANAINDAVPKIQAAVQALTAARS